MTVTPTSPAGSGQLELLKALGDNTRFAIYEHLASASRPLTTAEIAALLQLHPNTVR
ncbi:MAG: helix-turn-helix transcriptional regulator, partial [Acidimicrobiia bacterium]|nr:helix-turn-helix transcriptional regulator [Acidimicrobiia bacterium]